MFMSQTLWILHWKMLLIQAGSCCLFQRWSQLKILSAILPDFPLQFTTATPFTFAHFLLICTTVRREVDLWICFWSLKEMKSYPLIMSSYQLQWKSRNLRLKTTWLLAILRDKKSQILNSRNTLEMRLLLGDIFGGTEFIWVKWAKNVMKPTPEKR